MWSITESAEFGKTIKNILKQYNFRQQRSSSSLLQKHILNNKQMDFIWTDIKITLIWNKTQHTKQSTTYIEKFQIDKSSDSFQDITLCDSFSQSIFMSWNWMI